MFYVVEVTVPANTPDNNPVRETLVVEQGVITRVEVHFPPGCRGFVQTALFIGHYQLFPRPFGVWLRGDGETIGSNLSYEVSSPRATLTIYAKSPGSRYDHTIIWRLEVLPRAVAYPYLMVSKLVEAIYSFITMISGGRKT
jgi:hypothetical protein